MKYQKHLYVHQVSLQCLISESSIHLSNLLKDPKLIQKREIISKCLRWPFFKFPNQNFFKADIGHLVL